MNFNRGDLILERDNKYGSYRVFLVITKYHKKDNIYWIRDLGEPYYSGTYNNSLLIRIDFHKSAIKLNESDLTEEKFKVYQEFKDKYFKTDIV